MTSANESIMEAKKLMDQGIALVWEAGNPQEGLAVIEQAIQQQPEFFSDHFVAMNTKGCALLSLERYEEALTIFDQALKIQKNPYDAHTAQKNKALTLLQLEKYEESVEWYEKALEWNEKVIKDISQNWCNRGYALYCSKNYDEAIKSNDKALEYTPKNGLIFYSKACCYSLQNKVELALDNLKKAISLDSEIKKSAKTDSDFDNIRSDERFKAIVGTEFNVEAVQQFFNEALKNYDVQQFVFVGDLGTSVESSIVLPDNVREAYAFYGENFAQPGSFGCVCIYHVSVAGLPTYALEAMAIAGAGKFENWIEIYTEIGEEITCGKLQNKVITWGNQVTVRSDFMGN
ncbi:tetratricopeptide repeat protein [Limnoraphis robusta]|uniref:Tetratricopeptide repeat protein n=1 Tax=Limnoraphis robusta CCNP1315 TaxID=3110306 RepID=A0ABU5U0E7_9CYAN|nr:tetratricopeptide repeat protein [Limnoraphis robusta]MEA5520667.1 tetratricopeptide repeat protein [Limnoraphis robusta CCNP1315]MEA5545645.1 tetratricopeptide repeat protein [Limnoraphis robusta CCNP1324]